MSTVGLARMGRYLVPLGDAAGLERFMTQHLVAHDARARLGGWLARGAADLGLHSLAARLLGSGLRASGAAEPWTPEIRQALAGLLEEIGGPGDPTTLYLVDGLPSRESEYSGLAFCFVPDATDQPRPLGVALKVRTIGSARSGLGREWTSLSELRTTLPAKVRASVPEPLGHRRIGPVEIVATSCVPGRPMYVDLHNGLRPMGWASIHLMAAVRWLAAFQNATLDVVCREEDGHGLGDLGGGAGEPARPDWLLRLRDGLARRPLPLVPAHGDFWARNVLLDGSAVSGVVDWEHARAVALPTTDLFHFLVTYGQTVRWTPFRTTTPLTAFRRTFIDRNRVSRAVRDALVEYARARQVGLELLEQLFLLYLADMPVSASGRRAVGSSPAPAPDSFRDPSTRVPAYRMMLAASRSVFSR